MSLSSHPSVTTIKATEQQHHFILAVTVRQHVSHAFVSRSKWPVLVCRLNIHGNVSPLLQYYMVFSKGLVIGIIMHNVLFLFILFLVILMKIKTMLPIMNYSDGEIRPIYSLYILHYRHNLPHGYIISVILSGACSIAVLRADKSPYPHKQSRMIIFIIYIYYIYIYDNGMRWTSYIFLHINYTYFQPVWIIHILSIRISRYLLNFHILFWHRQPYDSGNSLINEISNNIPQHNEARTNWDLILIWNIKKNTHLLSLTQICQ